jgi:hypothetical protein
MDLPSSATPHAVQQAVHDPHCRDWIGSRIVNTQKAILFKYYPKTAHIAHLSAIFVCAG